MADKKKVTTKDLVRELMTLEQIVNALNTAVVALSYATKVKGDELDGVTPEQYVEHVTKHVHPLVKKADEISAEVLKKPEEKEEK